MNESIKLLLKKLSEDEALAAKFKDMKSPDEAYALAASVQEGFTKEEFVAAVEGIANGDLSADDLEKLAGGVDVDDTVFEATYSIASVAAIGALSI